MSRDHDDPEAPASRSAVFAVALLAYAALALAAVVLVGVTLFRADDPGRPGAGSAPQPYPGPGPSFVTAAGHALLLDGAPFRFTGFNLYDAAASDLYACPGGVRLDDTELDAAMSQIHAAGGTVVRFWAFQPYTRGGTDYAGVDRVLAAARAHDLLALPVLENQWSACSRPRGAPLSEVDGGSWFTSGYRSPLPGQSLSLRDYARRITHHYRDDPTILGWSLTNEAETTRVDADGTSDLVGFAADLAAVVHRADPHHLLTLGTQSNGAPGASGRDFTDVYALPGLDFAEVHDYANRGADDEPLPGAPTGALPDPSDCQAVTAPLACSFALVRALDKPIIVAEAGIVADDRASRATRADEFSAKIDAAFRSGASGYLIWQLNEVDTDGYGVLVGSPDPLFRVLQEAAQRWAL